MPSEGLRIPHGALVVVADHRRALLLKNEGDVTCPNLRKCRTVDSTDDTGAEGADVTFGRFNKGSRTLVRDFRDENMRSVMRSRFARRLLEVLREVAAAEAIGDMVIVATPHLLGELRERLDPSLKRLLRAEIARDLVNMPIRDIEAKLTD